MTDRTLRSPDALDTLAFDERGLLPVVAQDAATGAVLMVAWSDRGALERTLVTGDVHFWSRSRASLWRKGETSGNVLRLVSLHADCDGDTVLALVEPGGPACHTGERTCFGERAEPAAAGDSREGPAIGTASGDVLAQLDALLSDRARERPEGSYTTRLLDDENLRLKKLGEETAELVTALARGDGERIPEEAADVLYHVLAALHGAGMGLEAVLAVLAGRRR
ncbi:MAG: bifunctional phosphoribosyl-AMP cyclohydrolase/phosphoribosyl-ATP diphosphatase HisIE [Gemmatimonadetes bacterium]|nr:bifunctional phosphoribosyl-AMP cyclohydrolase/phosphoribosyl-ATP diphosphatase HisIE [Gemmatimonadota bacterium]